MTDINLKQTHLVEQAGCTQRAPRPDTATPHGSGGGSGEPPATKSTSTSRAVLLPAEDRRPVVAQELQDQQQSHVEGRVLVTVLRVRVAYMVGGGGGECVACRPCNVLSAPAHATFCPCPRTSQPSSPSLMSIPLTHVMWQSLQTTRTLKSAPRALLQLRAAQAAAPALQAWRRRVLSVCTLFALTMLVQNSLITMTCVAREPLTQQPHELAPCAAADPPG